jgi:molecular chaperone GrpE
MTDADIETEENEEAGEDAEEDVKDEREGENAETGEDTDIVARVAAVDEELAAEVSDRLEEATTLEEELSEMENKLSEMEAELATKENRIEDLESTLKRTKADFQNYKKRAEKKKEQIKERATEDLIERLIDVRDNLVRALEQDADADIRDGVEATLSTFDRVLEDENVEAIHPEPGTEVDPRVHEVVARVDGDQPEGRVEDVYRPGYRMAGKVLQAAQVTVSEGGDEDEGGTDEDATGDGAES